jgi:predicted nuclease of predicted toxin-antitoxin system
MLRLLIDINLSHKLADRLREVGYNCQHWKEVGVPTAPDTELSRWAKQNNAVVITRDLGFSNILVATRFNAPSVIQVRCNDSHSASLFPVILQALRQSEEQLHQGALVVVTENRLRIRTLPLIIDKPK